MHPQLPITSQLSQASLPSAAIVSASSVIINFFLCFCITLVSRYRAMASNSGEGSAEGGLLRGKAGPSPSEWKRIVAKTKRNTGQEYVSRETGKVVKKREVGPACKDGCYNKLGLDNIRKIHESFWRIGDFTLQNAYMQKLVVKKEVKRRRVKISDNQQPKRSHTRAYSFNCDGETYPVCALAFRNVLGLSGKRVETAINSVSATGTPRKDRRGSNKRKHAMPKSRKKQVEQHIQPFTTTTTTTTTTLPTSLLPHLNLIITPSIRSSENSAEPRMDQAIFAEVEKKEIKVEEEDVPSFISADSSLDPLYQTLEMEKEREIPGESKLDQLMYEVKEENKIKVEEEEEIKVEEEEVPPSILTDDPLAFCHQEPSWKEGKSEARVKEEENNLRKKTKATGGGPPPTPPKPSEEISLSASMMDVDLAMGNDVYETFSMIPDDDRSSPVMYALDKKNDPGVAEQIAAARDQTLYSTPIHTSCPSLSPNKAPASSTSSTIPPTSAVTTAPLWPLQSRTTSAMASCKPPEENKHAKVRISGKDYADMCRSQQEEFHRLKISQMMEIHDLEVERRKLTIKKRKLEIEEVEKKTRLLQNVQNKVEDVHKNLIEVLNSAKRVFDTMAYVDE